MRDMSSKSALISLLLVTTPDVSDERQYRVSPDCRVPGNHAIFTNQKSCRCGENSVLFRDLPLSVLKQHRKLKTMLLCLTAVLLRVAPPDHKHAPAVMGIFLMQAD